MPSTSAKRVSESQIQIGWQVLKPLARRRQAAGNPILTEQALNDAQAVLENEQFLRLYTQVQNGEKQDDALELEAPNEIKSQARAFKGNSDFIMGWIRDLGASLHEAEHVQTAAETDMQDAATVAAERRTAGDAKTQADLAAYAAANPVNPGQYVRDDQIIESYTTATPGISQDVATELHLPTPAQVQSGEAAPVTELPEDAFKPRTFEGVKVVEPGEKQQILDAQQQHIESFKAGAGDTPPTPAPAGDRPITPAVHQQPHSLPPGVDPVGTRYGDPGGPVTPVQPGTASTGAAVQGQPAQSPINPGTAARPGMSTGAPAPSVDPLL